MAATSILFYFVFLVNIDTAVDLIKDFMDNMNQSGVVDEEGGISVIGLFWNNLRGSMLATIMGLLPFVFIPLVTVTANGAVSGAVFAIIGSQGSVSIGKMLLLGILPHGIFELPAYTLGAALGVYLCITLNRAITGKNRQGVRAGQIFLELLRSYVLVIIPMLLAAAAIEAFVTPKLMAMGGIM